MNDDIDKNKDLLELEEAKKLFEAHNNANISGANINSEANINLNQKPVSPKPLVSDIKSPNIPSTVPEPVQKISPELASTNQNIPKEPASINAVNNNSVNQNNAKPFNPFTSKPKTEEINNSEPLNQSIYHKENIAHNIQEKQIPTVPNHLQKPLYKVILFWLSIVILAFALGFFIVNGPAFIMKLSYLFSSHNDSTQIYGENAKVNDSVTKTAGIELADNHLIIPKINVDAPIIWNVAEGDINAKMLEGIAHYNTTSLPDQMNGNVFLTGHSSNFWWIKSNYNQVFALLPKLEINDKIVVTYSGVKYVYQVYDKFIIKPSEISVLKPIENKTILSLMSCVPLGTNINRLIVRAELLYTDKENTSSSNSSQAAQNNSNNSSDSNQNTLNPITTNSNSSTNQNTSTDLQLPTIP